MTAPKCHPSDYIDFLIASPKTITCTEAARVQPDSPDPPAHDAFTRLLHRLEPDPNTLWQEAQPLVQKQTGVLVIDDSTLDKPYARAMDLVGHHWSGKHKRVVRGINLITLLWTDGDWHTPCDYRIYDKQHDGLTKNDHFQTMIQTAHDRGFEPECVLFDSWYASLENLKTIRELGWRWLTQLKSNRKVNWNRQGLKAVSEIPIKASGTVVHLKGYGLIRVFKIVSKDGDIAYWASSDLEMDELTRLKFAEWSWTIENYHRGIKQCCGVERSQARAGRAQRNHIGLAIRAFLRLESHSYNTGVSWYEAKTCLIRDAIRQYLKNPRYKLPSTA